MMCSWWEDFLPPLWLTYSSPNSYSSMPSKLVIGDMLSLSNMLFELFLFPLISNSLYISSEFFDDFLLIISTICLIFLSFKFISSLSIESKVESCPSSSFSSSSYSSESEKFKRGLIFILFSEKPRAFSLPDINYYNYLKKL